MVCTENFNITIRSSNGLSIPVNGTYKFEQGDDYDSTWTETHTLHADLRAVSPSEIVNQVSRPEQRQEYCGQRFVWSARIVECSEHQTVVEQQGGCG